MFNPGPEIAVLNGIDWLNDNGPAEWWDLVDLFQLNLDDGWDCVLGQVFAAKADETGIICGYNYVLWTFPEVANDPIRKGFCPVDDPRPLENEWRAAIEKIRTEVAA